MENKQFRLKRIRSQIRRLIPIVFLFFSICLMVFWQTKNPLVARLRFYISEKLSPVVSVLSAPVGWIKNAKENFYNVVFVYQRNRELEQENKILRGWRSFALQLQSEQNGIKKLVGYVPYPKSKSMTARLVMDVGNKFSRSYIALAGDKNGLKEGTIAMTDKGLFARVIEVGDYGSRLMLLTDYLSRVPVIVGEKRIPALLVGDNTNHPKLIFSEAKDSIREGDIILTSGYMGVYPSGLSVGLVRSVDDNEIDVSLFEDGENLEFVRLVDFGLADVLLKTDCKEP